MAAGISWRRKPDPGAAVHAVGGHRLAAAAVDLGTTAGMMREAHSLLGFLDFLSCL
jgi:hypothetical protein